MTFAPEKVSGFMEIFRGSRDKIRAFEGCTHLELLSNSEAPHVLFTLSHWESEEQLNLYRSSELFHSTWEKTKILFQDKPEAWSLVNML
jgi:quinol monooxygenase YgiN